RSHPHDLHATRRPPHRDRQGATRRSFDSGPRGLTAGMQGPSVPKRSSVTNEQSAPMAIGQSVGVSAEDPAPSARPTVAARTVHGVRVTEQPPAERRKTSKVSLLGQIFGGRNGPIGFGGWDSTLTVEVVDRRTGDVVLHRFEKYSIGARVAKDMGDDLDHLD